MPATKHETTVERPEGNVLVTKRHFAAPPRIVWKAWTDPTLVARWFAPKELGDEVRACTADVRVGGEYRYVFAKVGDPHEMAFSGVYQELEAPTRAVYTQQFSPVASEPPLPGAVLVTATFEADGDRTLFTSYEVYPSAEVLDDIVATGMETGMRIAMDQLEDLVVSLAG